MQSVDAKCSVDHVFGLRSVVQRDGRGVRRSGAIQRASDFLGHRLLRYSGRDCAEYRSPLSQTAACRAIADDQEMPSSVERNTASTRRRLEMLWMPRATADSGAISQTRGNGFSVPIVWILVTTADVAGQQHSHEVGP